MGEPSGADGWTLRVQIKPFVRWIWGGCLLMAFGGLLAATDRRYRLMPGRSRPRVDRAATRRESVVAGSSAAARSRAVAVIAAAARPADEEGR